MNDVLTKRNRSAYLAGPMRGLPYFNFPAFDFATAALQHLGWFIYSPAAKDRDTLDIDLCPDGTDEELTQQGFSLAGALAWDFARIMEADCVIALPGWERSTGVHWEFTVAYALGKPVFQYPELTPIELPDVVTKPVAVQSDRVWQEPMSPWPFRRNVEAEYARVRGVDGPGAYERTNPLPSTYNGPPDDPSKRRGHGTFVEVDGVDEFNRFIPRHPLLTDGVLHPPNSEHPEGTLTGRVTTPEVGSGEIRITDPSTGASKGSKLARFDLIPWDILYEDAELYGKGCAKYAARNWEGGYAWSLSIAALGRHLSQWLSGEDYDEETGLSHLIAVRWHAGALRWFQKHGKGTDDRG